MAWKNNQNNHIIHDICIDCQVHSFFSWSFIIRDNNPIIVSGLLSSAAS